jgi:ion channel
MSLDIDDRRSLYLLSSILLLILLSPFLGSHQLGEFILLISMFVTLVAFFGFASVGLFTYLGKPGAITSGRIYGSVSLSLMLATFWFALYNLTEAIHPGSFTQTGAVGSTGVPRPGFLYFSLITLTTVGYGDILPVTLSLEYLRLSRGRLEYCTSR